MKAAKCRQHPTLNGWNADSHSKMRPRRSSWSLRDLLRHGTAQKGTRHEGGSKSWRRTSGPSRSGQLECSTAVRPRPRTGSWIRRVAQMSIDRILTTHVGSLARPHELLDVMAARLRGDPYDHEAYGVLVRDSVDECVARQAECGIDIVGDGEVSKPGFYTYVRSRLAGFEPRPDEKMAFFEAEVAAFPDYYERYFAEAMTGGAIAPVVPLVCTGPVRYCGQEQLQVDIDNLVEATAKVPHVDAF